MSDIFGELARDWAHLRHHHASQAPAPGPVTLAAAATTEDTMSFITEVEDGYNAVKNEIAKLETSLPGALAKAKQFEGSPFALLAEKAAGAVLPPEAVAIAVRAADTVLSDLAALYAPQQPAPAQ